MVGDLIQSWCLILGIFFAPPCLANIKCIRPLYIIPSLPLSFRAFRSCSPMHLRYALLNENASIPTYRVGVGLLCLVCIWVDHRFFFGLQLFFCQV